MRHLILAALLALPAPVYAQATEQASYSLTIRGLSAGTLRFAGREEGQGYAVNGTLQSGGLVGVVRRIRYDASSQGRIVNGKFTPSSYTERADTGRRQSQAVMEYRRGVPQVKEYQPPREPNDRDVDASTQGGSVDPLTALFATLRDVDAGQECKTSLKVFDGRRATEVALAQPRRQGDTVTCAGEYRRIAGYSAEDMAEKTRFPFTLTYTPGPGGKMRVTEVTTDTLYGRARLTRR